ncbi:MULTISPECIES: helix-turn-helix domain-containing protein [unclassified Enterococcus]|uniref:helix-turn-helix domain-containing protein n=1 Tax=unclassified Enterococcus TaxID=2608891 RepID=UPI001A9AE5CB|nr:helix-turn-helix domain-containing protein [Enterococcus sp. DIV1271a]MBO1298675.1 helix-turn-helix domain-containing protein [Enterococcus sp. DIV1271a]
MRQIQSSFVTNKTTLRWLHLLEYMEHVAYTPIRELSKVIKSSSRTIIEDLQNIKEYFNDSIEMKTSNIGYKLKILDIEKYFDKKKAMISNEPMFKILESIFLGEILSINEWADIFFLSPATLMRYLRKIEPILARYDLSINKSQVNLIGEEVNIRHFYFNFYYESDITPHTVFPPLIIQEIGLDLKGEEFSRDFSNVAFEEICYMIYIILERTSHGHYVKLDPGIVKLFRKEYYLELKKLKKLLSNHLQMPICEKEIIYFYALTLSKRTVFDVDLEKIFCDKLGKEPRVIHLTERYLEEIDPPHGAVESSTVFIQSFFSNMMLKHKISPVLNTVIPDLNTFVKKEFPEEVEKNTQFLRNQLKGIPCFTLETIEDVSTVFTILMDCLKELYWGKPKKIAFLLEGNQFISQRIQVTARKNLGSYQELYFPNALDISHGYFKTNQFDIIVTNYAEHLSNFSGAETCLLFNKIPNDTDWQRLMSLIDVRI